MCLLQSLTFFLLLWRWCHSKSLGTIQFVKWIDGQELNLVFFFVWQNDTNHSSIYICLSKVISIWYFRDSSTLIQNNNLFMDLSVRQSMNYAFIPSYAGECLIPLQSFVYESYLLFLMSLNFYSLLFLLQNHLSQWILVAHLILDIERCRCNNAIQFETFQHSMHSIIREIAEKTKDLHLVEVKFNLPLQCLLKLSNHRNKCETKQQKQSSRLLCNIRKWFYKNSSAKLGAKWICLLKKCLKNKKVAKK